eukprot:scaffold256736_cov36-Tisochrysis_lutea.AAC.3
MTCRADDPTPRGVQGVSDGLITSSTHPSITSIQVGGPIGLVKDGACLEKSGVQPATAARLLDAHCATRLHGLPCAPYDLSGHSLSCAQVDVSDVEMANRKANWKAPPYKYTRGTMYRYIKTVSSAQKGCVTDE